MVKNGKDVVLLGKWMKMAKMLRIRENGSKW